MNLARVRGTVVATRRTDGIENPRFLLVEDCDQRGGGRNEWLVALDLVGANRGQMVLCAQGSSCRQTEMTEGKPMDCLVVAIVDSMDQSGVDVWKEE